jgi:Tol biopolymer transport system component
VCGLAVWQSLRPAVSSEPRFELLFTQVPHHALQAGTGKTSVPRGSGRWEGSRLVRLDAAGKIRVLTPDLASAAQPALSFDGRKVLFSAKHLKSDPWDIWEMDLDGGSKRQITQNMGDCGEPHYLPPSALNYPLYDEDVRWITFTSTAANTFEESGGSLATALYARSLDPVKGRGIVTWRTTFNLSSDFSTSVLKDGRILYTSHQQMEGEKTAGGHFLLMTANWDGSGLNLFCNDVQGGKLKAMPCEMPDRTVVFVESDGNRPDGGGSLGRVSLQRPLHSYESISSDAGRYRNPHPLPNGNLLVSHVEGNQSYGLYQFDFSRKTIGTKFYADGKWDAMDAIPLAPSTEPSGLISAVFDQENTGDLQCMNVYESDQPESASIKKGDVKKVRFIQGIPLANPSASATSRVMGEAVVEPDGSFYVRLPADVPFYIQTLDGQGRPLMTMPRWMWVRKGTSRGCIGCHENKELAPENRVSQAMFKAYPQLVDVKK